MGRYVGETYNIPLEQGGFCHNKNIDTIAPVDMVYPSCNIWLNEGGIRKRGGTTPIDTSVMCTVAAPVFTGSGLDDLTSNSIYTHTEGTTFTIQIDNAGTPNTFKWMRTGGNWTYAVEITGSAQALEYGLEITFAATTGHTKDDYWSIDVPAPEVSGLYDFNLINGNQFIIRHTTDGKLWKTNTDTIKTGWTADKIAQFVQYGDSVIICNGADCPVTWNGVAGSVTDFTAGVKAQGTITMSGIAVAGARAQGTITMSGIATAYETFVVDDQTFTWKVARAKKGDVTIGADAAAAVVNLAHAIKEDLSSVTADDNSTTTVIVTATEYGIGANSMVFTEASTNMVMDGSGTMGTTTAGVDEETFVVDDQTFTWKTEREEGITGEVTIGADAPAAIVNIVAAITEDLSTVEAVDGAGDTVVVTAVSYGTDANAMVFTEASTNMSMNGSETMGGTTAGVKDQLPTDWTGSNYPSQMLIHGRGNSKRTWALGCSLNPENIYVTTNSDLTNFAQATVLLFTIATGDDKGIVGGIEYGNRLLLFGKNKSFIINDSDTNTDNWGYSASQWAGGAAHQRLIIKTPNDIICMMENGEIYSVSAAEEYGDYKAASLTRPSFMHEWIKTYINLSHVEKFHAIYDPVLRAIKFFMVRVGMSEIDTALVYFIDRTPDKAWVILDNQNFESGYSASSACLVRVSTGNQKIYTGGYNGRVWKLGETNRNDNDNAFISRYKTPLMSFENVRISKRYDWLRIVSVSHGSCSATFTWTIDDIEKDSEDVNFSAGGDVLGSFILGTSILGGLNITEQSIRLGYMGKRIQLEAKSNTANEDFFLSQFLIDFIPIGKRM